MKALVFHGPGKKAWEEKPKPTLKDATDAIVRVTCTTICGTDLHILKGDVPEVSDGRILGHEAVGVVDAVGSAVSQFKPGDHVIVSCITSCGRCVACKRGMYSHCARGGWVLGHLIDGTQADFVRVPFADNSLYAVPEGADEAALVMLSDILPTGFEVGVRNGAVKPGDTVAIIGAGPIGLAALMTAQFYAPAELIMVDLDEHRLAAAKKLGATWLINSADGKAADGKAAEKVLARTGGRGVDVAIEAVGVGDSFDICQDSLAAGGHLANVGVHGKGVQLKLEKLWTRNVTITTGLVDTDTTPLLLKTITAGRLKPRQLITHEFALGEMIKAWDTFGNASKENALKVLLKA
jgi:alcohol dehydrogenase